MNRTFSNTLIILLALASICVVPFLAVASMTVNDPQGHSHNMHTDTKLNVGDFILSYDIVNVSIAMDKMKAMGHKHAMTPAEGATHYLTIHINQADGKKIGRAVVKAEIHGPDHKEQEKIMLRMGAGFGAQVNMGATGAYTINVHFKAKGAKHKTSFVYHMK